MSLADPMVLSTINDDGSADFTISVDGEDHKFSVSPNGETGWVEYEETLSWKGEIRVSEPREEVWKMLMQSEEMTKFLESSDLKQVRRNR